MLKKRNPLLFALVFAAGLTAPVVVGAVDTGSHRVESGSHQVMGGVDIYYGIMPAQIAAKHPETHEEKSMHGGAPGGKDDYHLVIALYDAEGKRITNAQVWATVGELGLAGTRKKLDPMVIGDTMSFGSYFVLRGAQTYRIAVEVRLPHAEQPVEALFDYRMR